MFAQAEPGLLKCVQNLVREQLPKLRSDAERAAMLANIICEAFGNHMGSTTVNYYPLDDHMY